MATLPQATAARVQRALAKDGWFVARTTNHVVMHHSIKPGTVLIPNHPTQTVKDGTLRNIIASAGLTVDEFRNLL